MDYIETLHMEETVYDMWTEGKEAFEIAYDMNLGVKEVYDIIDRYEDMLYDEYDDVDPCDGGEPYDENHYSDIPL